MSTVKVIFEFEYQGKRYAFNTSGKFEYGAFENTVYVKLPEEKTENLLDSLFEEVERSKRVERKRRLEND
jgi:hypothetical protein